MKADSGSAMGLLDNTGHVHSPDDDNVVLSNLVSRFAHSEQQRRESMANLTIASFRRYSSSDSMKLKRAMLVRSQIDAVLHSRTTETSSQNCSVNDTMVSHVPTTDQPQCRKCNRLMDRNKPISSFVNHAKRHHHVKQVNQTTH